MGKRVLISGYIGFQNFGDDAIFGLLVKYLKRNNCNVTALSGDPRATQRMFKVNALHYTNFLQILWGIIDSNVLISGGGSLLQNSTSSLSLLYYLGIIFLAKLLGTKVIIFAQGIGPIYGKWWQRLTRFVLKRCDLVTVRDIYSQRILKKWGINSRYVIDPVWDLNCPPLDNEGCVGVQLRSYRFLHPTLLQELAKYIGIYFGDRKIKIFSFQNEQDSDLAYKFEYWLKAQCSDIKTEVVLPTSHRHLIEEFSHLEYLFAMRYHAVLLALKMGIKVLPISYDVKVQNLAMEFNIPYIEAAEESDYYSYIRDLKNYKEDHYFKMRREERFNWEVMNKYIK